MTEFYDDLADTAKALIDEFGRNITLRRKSAGAYSASSDSHAGGTTVEHIVKAVFLQFKEHEIDGEIIQRGDIKVLIAGVKPEQGDILIDGSSKPNIVNIEAIKPGDTELIWKVQARR